MITAQIEHSFTVMDDLLPPLEAHPELKHLLTNMRPYFHNDNELFEALDRAIAAATEAHLDVNANFKPVFSSTHKSTVENWRLSAFGYCLVIINGNPTNEVVGKLQTDLVRKLINEMNW